MRIVPRCFVPRCQTGYPSDRKRCKAEGKKCLELFSVPRDEKMLDKWKNALPQSYREFSWTDYVCIKHFHEDDIDLYCIKTLPDGTSSVAQRKKPRLKSSAVPSVFPKSTHMPRVCSVEPSQPKPMKIDIQAEKPQLPVLISFEPPVEVYQESNQTMPEVFDSLDVGLSSTNPVVASIAVSKESNVSATERQEEVAEPDANSIGPVSEEKKALWVTKIDLTTLFDPENIFSVPPENVNEPPEKKFLSDEKKNPHHFLNQTLNMNNNFSDQSHPNEEARTQECYLTDCLQFLTLPSRKWTVHATANNYIVCAYWVESTIEAVKRVIILDDLSVRIFLNEIEICCSVRITTLGVLYSLLEEVEKYKLCLESRIPSPICIGVVSSQRSIYCSSCLIFKADERKSQYDAMRATKKLRDEKCHWKPKMRERLKIIREKENQIKELKTQIQHERVLNRELKKLDADL